MADINYPGRDAAEARIREIHRIALAEILTKSGDFDHDAYFKELEQLKKRPQPFEWYEAVAMTCLIGRMRQRKVNTMLEKLSYRRRLDDHQAAYDKFAQRLIDYMHPEEFTPPTFDHSFFSDLDHKPIWSTVEAHIAALRDKGYEVFLNSGTLLGVVRDQALIEHDDDVDLALILKAKSAKKAAQEWGEVREMLREMGLLHRITDKNPAIYKLTPAGNVNIDLFPAWQSKGKFYVFPHTNGGLSVEDVLPLGTCAVTGSPIPAFPEKMLAENYGTDWRTPDPHFQFPWIRARAKFAPFLEGVS